jgi:DNA-binding NarL/FixJ family response regulator
MTQPKTRVFIVDDHPLVREWLTVLLHQQSDLEVSGQAEDASGALAVMIAHPPDVAIIDLSLKTSSGLDLIKNLAAQLPDTKVLVLSMHEEVFYAERALRAGARGYVMKRESTECVVEAIRAVCRGQIYASAQMLAQLTERMVGRARPTTPNGVEMLSDREIEVFRRLGEGQSTRQIGEELRVSIKTVQAYCARIKGKLQLQSGVELVREAVCWVEQQQPR